MLYRMRVYQAVRENLPLFHAFFRTWLLPVQLRHGARLVGRWEAEDGRVVAIWEYDDRAAYERIESAVLHGLGSSGDRACQGTCLSRAAPLAWPRCLWPVTSDPDATATRKSSAAGQLWPS